MGGIINVMHVLTLSFLNISKLCIESISFDFQFTYYWIM